MMPDFPIAKRAVAVAQEKYFQFAVTKHLGGFFGAIPRRALKEGQAMRQEYNKAMIHETAMTPIQSSLSLTTDEVIINRFIIFEKLWETASDFARQQVQMTIRNIDEVTSLTGNVIDSRGDYTVEHFFQSIERVSIDFDEDGNPKMPGIVGSPETVEKIISVLKATEHLPESKARMESIMALKKKQWNDRENNRKLVD